MKPSTKAKLAGFKSLAEFSKIAGESEQNLINWNKHKPLRFEIFLRGAVALKVERSLKSNKEPSPS